MEYYEKPTITFISRNVVFNEEALIQTKVETKITAPNLNVKEDSKLKVESTGTQEFKEEKK